MEKHTRYSVYCILINDPNFWETIDYRWITLFYTISKRVWKSILSLKNFMAMAKKTKRLPDNETDDTEKADSGIFQIRLPLS